MDIKFTLSIIVTVLCLFLVLERGIPLSLSQFFTSKSSPYLFCEHIVSEIGPQQFFYQEHREKQALEFRVTPIAGDPDLFVSYSAFPHFDLNRYDHVSNTCGVEVVTTNSPARPVFTGVYCYEIYRNCTFQLSACVLDQQHLSLGNENRLPTKIKNAFLVFIEVLFTEILPFVF